MSSRSSTPIYYSDSDNGSENENMYTNSIDEPILRASSSTTSFVCSGHESSPPRLFSPIRHWSEGLRDAAVSDFMKTQSRESSQSHSTASLAFLEHFEEDMAIEHMGDARISLSIFKHRHGIQIERKIFEYLEDDDLITLLKVDKTRNYAALQIFFYRHGVDYQDHLILDCIVPPLVTGLNLAFGLESLHSITCYFSHNVADMYRQIDVLIHCLRRLTYLYKLVIVFPHSGITKDQTYVIDYVKWAQIFDNFLDIIGDHEARFCVELTGGETLSHVLEYPEIRLFEGFGTWKTIHREWDQPQVVVINNAWQPQVPKSDDFPSMTFSAEDNLLMIPADLENLEKLRQMFPKSIWRTPPIIPYNCPDSVMIGPSMFLQPWFFPATFNFFIKHGYNITTLEFIGARTDERLWKVLLTNIHLPNLKSFGYVHDTNPTSINHNMTTPILINFLSRHLTIEELKLCGVKCGLEYIPPISRQPLLPLLVFLEGSARIVSWIIEKIMPGPKDGYYKNLKVVIIKTEHQFNSALSFQHQPRHDYSYFEQAVWDVGILHQRVRLVFRWEIEDGLWEWVNEQVGSEKAIMRRLEKIEYFVLHCDHISFDHPEKVRLLVRFFCLLPGVKSVHIHKKINSEELLRHIDVRAVKFWRPALSQLWINDEEILNRYSSG